MKIFFYILIVLSIPLLYARRNNNTVRNIAAGLCLLSCLGLLVGSLLPKPQPPGPLEKISRTGELVSRAILETHDKGEVLLVTWPLVGQRWENMVNQMEQGLKQGLGSRFTIRRFPVEEWRDLDPPLGNWEGPPPAATWAALAERLPECEILVSMVGHPNYPVIGLYTRCESLFLTDAYFTLSPKPPQVDAAAPLNALVLERPMTLGETLLDTVELVVPR